MGTALVMPTNEVKMLMPNTAANLQRALRKPNAVVLRKKKETDACQCFEYVLRQNKIQPKPQQQTVTDIFLLISTVELSQQRV